MSNRISRPAIVASSFHPHVGGVEELVRQLAHQLRTDSDPLVATMRWPKDLPRRESHEDIPVYRYVFRVPERRPRQFAAACATRRLIVRHMTSDLRCHGVDLVHVQCVSANAWYAERVASALGVPLVVTLQGELTMDASGVYERSRILPRLLRRLMATADAVTACSEATLDEAERFTGINLGQRGRVIYNGVNLREFDGSPGEPPACRYVLGIGRLVPQKGYDVLLRAFAEIADTVRHQLVIAGDGVSKAQLEEEASRLGLAGRVWFPGSVARVDVPGLFAGADAFVLASRHEPMGIVNIEAMAAGAPVIATAVGGVPEFVRDGYNGLLVPPDDPHAMATALRRLVQDAELRDRLAAGGRETARRFDWASVTDEYREVYDDARGRAAAKASKGSV